MLSTVAFTCFGLSTALKKSFELHLNIFECINKVIYVLLVHAHLAVNKNGFLLLEQGIGTGDLTFPPASHTSLCSVPFGVRLLGRGQMAEPRPLAGNPVEGNGPVGRFGVSPSGLLPR